MTANLERVRAVTANFFFWQGLRWVPLGIALILLSFGPLTKRAIGDPWASIISLTTLFIALWLSTTVLGGYYARAYGRVQLMPGQHARRDTIKWLVVYPVMFVAMILDWRINAPVLLSGAAFGAGIEAYRRSTGGGRQHYIVAATLFALLTFIPTLGLATSRELLVPLFGVLGVVYVVGGVLDHRELVRVLGPARMATEDNGSAI